VQRQLKRCLLDGLGAALGGVHTRAAQIAAAYAEDTAREGAATVFVTGSRLAVPGAVLANVISANALDIDDGYRPSKGHPGGFVIGPTLAACQERGATDLLAAMAAGYEVGTRAAVATHRYYTHYHASGSWGAMGAAACVGRVLGLNTEQLGNALGLAEYHAALSPIERCLGTPAMTKDAIGWGAYAGTSAAYLAARGFTGNPSLLSDPANRDLVEDLGTKWRVMDLYFKAYPCCRWAQPGVEAVVSLQREHAFSVSELAGIVLHTFREATLLQQTPPRNTEEAQYHLFWAVAAMLVYGTVGPAQVSDQAMGDSRLVELLPRMRAVIEPDLQARFPAEALGWVEITLTDGSVLRSGEFTARGDAHAPLSDEEVKEKFSRLAEPVLREGTGEIIDIVMDVQVPGNGAILLDRLDLACRRASNRGSESCRTVC
jgi:2-methylcitrate dehydratase PrpD